MKRTSFVLHGTAAAMGVPVIASDACGRGDLANVTTVGAGDVAGLLAALHSSRHWRTTPPAMPIRT